MEYIKWTQNSFQNVDSSAQEITYFSEAEVKKAYQFHSTMPGYEKTPLHTLDNLSAFIGVNGIYVKDESKRLGLNAFKGLGASYAMASYFSKKLSIDLASTRFADLLEQVQKIPTSTFATVTAGNHGKGVAWAAHLFGQQSKVYLPKGSSQNRLQAVQELEAFATITDVNYDETVTNIANLAEEKGWVLMQDTAWEGYEEIPLLIMQGYTTIVAEVKEQLKDKAFDKITHVFLQAGVGSFAASMAAAIYNARRGSSPKIVIVEPSEANCIYQSAESPTGDAQSVNGNLSTMMAGLACGEPSSFGWKILKTLSDTFFSVDDCLSAQGMRLLGIPMWKDPKIISGESGAVPVGLLYEIMTNDRLNEIKEELELDESSNVLVINTEGDTDPGNYEKIVNNR